MEGLWCKLIEYFFTKSTDFIISSFQKSQVSKSLFCKNRPEFYRLTLILFQKISKNPYAQNFYLLIILLNLFEISNRVLEFKNSISIWKCIILPENLFQTCILRRGAMCVYSSWSRDKVEYMHIEPLCKLRGPGLKWIFRLDIFFFRFKSNFQISKLVWRFQINSNGFLRHRD